MTYKISKKFDMIIAEFRKINSKVFSNNLILPEFVIREELVLGFACRERGYDTEAGVIFLPEYYPNKRVFRNILCMNMVHLWQIQVMDEKPNYGASYQGWLAPAKKAGYDIDDVREEFG